MPQEFDGFFTAAAGVSGALIGLLFVAITVTPERARHEDTRVDYHARAASALLAFSNALVLSLVALVPGVSLGWWMVSGSVGIVAFALASGRAAITAPARRVSSFRLAIVLLVVAGYQVYAGVRLIQDSSDQGAVEILDYVVIGCLAGGINRAWELMSMRNTNLFTSLRALTHGDHEALAPVPMTVPVPGPVPGAEADASVEGEGEGESGVEAEPKE
jgi:hypothetical protein